MALYGYWKGAHPAPAELGGDIRPDDRSVIRRCRRRVAAFIPLGFGDVISSATSPSVSGSPRARRAGLEEHYLDRIRSSEEFSYLLSGSEYTGEFHTVKDWSYRSVDMAGGYFAVGDAACFVDPILSSGCTWRCYSPRCVPSG